MPTPEGKVKAAVKEALVAEGLVPYSDWLAGRAAENFDGFFFMPVAGPYSIHGIHDFIGCWRGRFFTIETKAPNNPEDATPHQEKFQEVTTLCGGLSYIGVRDASVVQRLKDALCQ